MPKLKVNIVIPTCNRPEALSLCLNALLPQLTPNAEWDVDVLIMDDGTTDATKDTVLSGYPWARWHAGPRRGPAANRNAGARLALGQWIIFLDDDCVPRPTFMASYLAAFRSATAGGTIVGSTFSPKAPSLLWEAPLNPRGEWMISCNFALPRELFHTLGGFDERYPMAAFEDTELEARMRAERLSITFLPDAAVDHPLRRIPAASKLARRWEARVISVLDLGASPWQVAWRLPEHALKVIISRFRGQRLSWDLIWAAAIFSAEFALLLCLLPGWISVHAKGKRSAFWASQAARGGAPARFGL